MNLPVLDIAALAFNTHSMIALTFGFLGIVMTVVANTMRAMLPLRWFAIAAEAFFVINAVLSKDLVNLGLHAALFFINAYRLWDLRKLLAELEDARSDSPPAEWLLPHMKKKRFKKGTVLFSKGEEAKAIFYVVKGTVAIAEFGQKLGSGHLIGEIGLFSQDRRRTASVVCETDCECYTMTDEAIYLLYFQNPKLGFYLVRLIVQRLLTDLSRNPKEALAEG